MTPPTNPPRLLLIAGATALLLLVVPVIGLLQRMPWSALRDILSSDAVADALRTSLVVSITATALAVLLGLPLAWVLARVPLPGRRVVRAIVILPMVLPPVVGGTALLFALGRNGLVGQWLDQWFGIQLPFSTS